MTVYKIAENEKWQMEETSDAQRSLCKAAPANIHLLDLRGKNVVSCGVDVLLRVWRFQQ